ncbi:MAG TPA: hypothetical protein VJJ52_01935 [Candidatus Nanoarchaeia archaeon]|nr:hypothetical protein [Candidatus Nanoarchaeia archaeon]
MTTDAPNYHGEVAVARVLDRIQGDNFYKLRAKIQTGHMEGSDAFVSYRGNPSQSLGNIVVRLDGKPPDSTLNLDGKVSTFFVTSAVPHAFDFARSEDVILYGIWLKRMKQDYNYPLLGTVSNFYDTGTMAAVLHYGTQNGNVVPYIVSRNRPHIDAHEDGEIRGANTSLSNYVKKMRSRFPHAPMIVTIDQSITPQSRIISLFSQTQLKAIEMQPQQ